MNAIYPHYAFSSFSAVSPPPRLGAPAIRAVVFDLGGVLIDWNPRYLFSTMFAQDARMEQFLTEVCSPSWNDAQDRGRSWQSAVQALTAEFPAFEEQIRAYDVRWEETLGDALDGTVALLDALRLENRVRLIALTNWSQEKFPIARARFAFLAWFEAIIVSGEEGMAKPDRAIFERMRTRLDLHPGETLFIDDTPRNVEAARALGYHAVLFQNPGQLADALQAYGVTRS